jgi:hypothetical protein
MTWKITSWEFLTMTQIPWNNPKPSIIHPAPHSSMLFVWAIDENREWRCPKAQEWGYKLLDAVYPFAVLIAVRSLVDLINLGGSKTHRANRDVKMVPRHKRRMLLVEGLVRPVILGVFIAVFYGNRASLKKCEGEMGQVEDTEFWD